MKRKTLKKKAAEKPDKPEVAVAVVNVLLLQFLS